MAFEELLVHRNSVLGEMGSAWCTLGHAIMTGMTRA
jgi:hypothetical protein